MSQRTEPHNPAQDPNVSSLIAPTTPTTSSVTGDNSSGDNNGGGRDDAERAADQSDPATSPDNVGG